ncbi:hypothetical protein CLOM_g8899 [Closterium sp. NIES-68]|nr:hypothetical protein CLOM_g2396 [Closterium sp. NIES-68]GJP49721.1 hypothetical protein CLOM_g8899 [Closterium sp. NIES-68]GJP74966.1 hypothetical protein CLOP_g5472 [Closterium sp. NIES-67]GJP77164.1 hypothetical protein CLOP_g7593 [Closterium sp. NIES-67]
MSFKGPRKGFLEAFKFTCYVGIPIAMMIVFANNQDNLEAIIRNRAYVIYPPEGPRPPTAEEVRGLAQMRQQVQEKQAGGK